MQFVNAKTNMTFKANTKNELVEELYATSWIDKTQCVELEEWMRLCAIRIYEGYEVEIVYVNSVDFADELIRFNFIKEIN